MSDVTSGVYNDLGSLSQLKAQSAEKPQEALKEAAKQFESLFVSMMVKAMRETLPKDGMFSSNSMDSYQEMFDQQLALDLSRRGGMGLSDLIEKQLSTGIGAAEFSEVSNEDKQAELSGLQDSNLKSSISSQIRGLAAYAEQVSSQSLSVIESGR